MSDFKIKTYDDREINASKFLVSDAIASVQIAHGMAEHRARYLDFIQFLNDNNINVYIADHRGHGENITDGDRAGFFKEKNGWSSVVADMVALSDIANKDNPTTPLFILGHSMGSFLARTYFYKYPTVADGFIFMGTGSSLGIASKIGLQIAKHESKKNSSDKKSTKLDKLSFGNFNKPFKKDGTTGFEWLSRDKDEVDKYMADPLCGFVSTTNLFENLISGNIFVNSKKIIASYKKDTPVLFISGEKDKVGGKKAVKKLAKAFKKAKMQDAESQIYDGARHEILNETNKRQVYADILKWLLSKV